MLIRSPSRIGMIYFSYGNDVKRFIVNKMLFLTGVILCHAAATELLLFISTVVLVVPIVKKIVSEVFSYNFICEATLIISETILHVALDQIDTVVIFLMMYHIFDAVLYITSSLMCKSFESNPMFCENPISYRMDEDGNYVLSNNELVPNECVVINGSALLLTRTVRNLLKTQLLKYTKKLSV